MITFEVDPERADYIQGEEVHVIVRVVNNTADPIEIPDPSQAASEQLTYWLAGPGDLEGQSLRRYAPEQEPEGQEGGGEVAAPAMVRVEPQAVHTSRVSLSSFADLSVSGEYRLQAQLAWSGGTATSAERSFRVGPMTPASIHVGLGRGALTHGEGEGAFIHQGVDSSQLYTFGFLEYRPGISEVKTYAPQHRLALGAGATDVGVPWKNSPLFDELVSWVVWREGASIRALSSTSATPLAQDLPEAAASLVRPPLKTTGGPVDVLAVAEDGQTLYLVQVADALSRQDPPVQLAWSAPLPAKPHAVTAALAPASQGSRRHVALTAQHDAGFSVYHAHYDQEGSLSAFQSATVEAGRLLQNAPLAMVVDAEGTTRVSAVAVMDAEMTAETQAYAVVEVRFTAAGQPMGDPHVLLLGMLPAQPVGGAVLYVVREDAVVRREVVLRLDDERTLRLNEAGALVPVSVPGRPTTPLVLAPGSQVSYLLYADPDQGLHFEPL